MDRAMHMYHMIRVRFLALHRRTHTGRWAVFRFCCCAVLPQGYDIDIKIVISIVEILNFLEYYNQYKRTVPLLSPERSERFPMPVCGVLACCCTRITIGVS